MFFLTRFLCFDNSFKKSENRKLCLKAIWGDQNRIDFGNYINNNYTNLI